MTQFIKLEGRTHLFSKKNKMEGQSFCNGCRSPRKTISTDGGVTWKFERHTFGNGAECPNSRTKVQ